MEARHSLALKFFFGSEGCWSGRRDLNPRPPVPQTGALTGLRHAPTGTAGTIGMHLSRRNLLHGGYPERLAHHGSDIEDGACQINEGVAGNEDDEIGTRQEYDRSH